MTESKLIQKVLSEHLNTYKRDHIGMKQAFNARMIELTSAVRDCERTMGLPLRRDRLDEKKTIKQQKAAYENKIKR